MENWRVRVCDKIIRWFITVGGSMKFHIEFVHAITDQLHLIVTHQPETRTDQTFKPTQKQKQNKKTRRKTIYSIKILEAESKLTERKG